MPLPPSAAFAPPMLGAAPMSGLMERLGKYVGGLFSGGGSQVQAAQPPMAPLPGPSPRSIHHQPFEGLPSAPPFSKGISEPPPLGLLSKGAAYGELPPSPGGVPGWMSAPTGSSFDPSILAPPRIGEAQAGLVTSPQGNSYSAVPRGSVADLEGQLQAKSYLDALFPDLTPQGRLEGLKMDAQARELTPLRPGEQVPKLPAEARVEQRKQAAMEGMQQAMQDWAQRKERAKQALRQQGAGLSAEQLQTEELELDDAFDKERQAITLRFAPDLLPGFRAGLSDLE